MKHNTGNSYSTNSPFTKWERSRQRKADARFAVGLGLTLLLFWVVTIIG